MQATSLADRRKLIGDRLFFYHGNPTSMLSREHLGVTASPPARMPKDRKILPERGEDKAGAQNLQLRTAEKPRTSVTLALRIVND